MPISGSFGVTQDVVYESSPYDAAKNFVGVNCATPPQYAKLPAKGKLAYATGKRFGYRLRCLEIDQREPRTFRREQHRCRATDGAARAGDEHALVFETHRPTAPLLVPAAL